MTLKELLVGFGTQVHSIWMIGLHAFGKGVHPDHADTADLGAKPYQ